MTEALSLKLSAVEKMAELVTKLEGIIQQIGPTAQRSLDNPLISDSLRASAMNSVNAMIGHAQSGLAEIKQAQVEAAAAAGSSASELAASWRVVMAKTTNVAESIKTQDAVSDLWHGQAKDKYVKARDVQAKAASRLETQAVLVSGILAQANEAETDFVYGILVGVAAGTAGFVAALASSATIAGIPAAPFIAVAAAGVATAAFATARAKFSAKLETLAGQLEVEALRQDDFGPGNWPQAVASDFRKATPDDNKVDDWDPTPKK